MKKIAILFTTMIIATSCIAGVIDTLTYSPFGKILVMNPSSVAEDVALVISDKNGWTKAMDELAEKIVNEKIMVVGINLHHLISAFSKTEHQCLYPASDFENLSIYIQKKYKLKTYHKPILIGKASGATLTYALIAQAPANTFKGGIAIDFLSTIGLNKKFCKGSGLISSLNDKQNKVTVSASPKLHSPLMVISEKEHSKTYSDNAIFFKEMDNATIITQENKDNEESTKVLASSIQKIQSIKPFGGSIKYGEPTIIASEIADIPFVVTDAKVGKDSTMALIISGDGGWTDFDQSIANELAIQGVPSVGLDTQRYFWEKKTPERTAIDMEKLLLYFSKKFNCPKIVLTGYSFGADVIPFIANRLSQDLKDRLVLVAMLSPDDKTDFEVTISSMLNLDMETDYDVAPEVKKLDFVPKLCIYGSDEGEEQDQELFRKQDAQIFTLKGGHHYGDHFKEIITIILNQIQQ